MKIPAVQYHRPDGRREDGAIQIDDSEFTTGRVEAVSHQYDLINRLGIEITVEMLVYISGNPAASTISLCLDDGDHDYQQEVVRNFEVAKTVLDMVEKFDYEEYQRSRELNELERREPREPVGLVRLLGDDDD